MIVYIAGLITGHLRYRENFKKAEDTLTAMGHIVINPSRLPSGLEHYMQICKAMIDQADAVFFLKGWKCSKGSNEELDYARGLKKKLFYEEDF